MSSPTHNSVATTNYSPGSFGAIASLLMGTKWGGSVGSGVTLTYSFPPGATSWWDISYSPDDEPDGYRSMNATQQTAVADALRAWANVTNLNFVKVADGETVVGDLRFTFSNVLPQYAGWAYGPSSLPRAGDVWISSNSYDDSSAKGSDMFHTFLHEIGHAIGLNHSFDLPVARDNYFYTVMSYTASPWSPRGAGDDVVAGQSYASFYPTTPMYYDILAIQALYGRDTTTNAGNNNYVFSGGAYFQTIYDAGGTDTITYTGTLACTIYLGVGSFSTLSSPITFDGGTSRATVCIGPNTAIENAVGGIGADILLGNSIANSLNGGRGSDVLRGGAGNDTLIGGLGRDVLQGDAGGDVFDFNSVAEIGISSTRDVIMDFDRTVDYIDLRTIDADTSTPSVNDAFKFVASPGSVFYGVKGQLRWFQSNPAGTVNDRTYLVGDVNGDRVADFQIEFRGLHTLRADLDILV